MTNRMGVFLDTHQEMVRDFHKTFDIPVNDRPTVPSWEERKLRLRLIYEEFLELCEASGIFTNLPEDFEAVTDGDVDLVEVADALADLEYVIKGAGVTYGIDLSQIFHEVHRSNMTKVGGHKREDGKWVKPATYESPQLKPILVSQGAQLN
jgi:predicted HAD superfamily Cof-like phosphohydrolase